MVQCAKSTAPVTLPTASSASKSLCDLKCHYNYDYPPMVVNAFNRVDHILYTYDGGASAGNVVPPVQYNHNGYDMKSIRLYSPSIHKWGTASAAAELVIKHVPVMDGAGGKPLIVCIPIQDTGTIGRITGNLDAFISDALQAVEAGSHGVPITLNSYTVSSFIPAKPFYSYTGSLPYLPCSPKQDFIVFELKDALSASKTTIMDLRNVIPSGHPDITAVAPAQTISFNKTGAISGPTSDTDGIYIDCQPTGQEGDTLVATDVGSDLLKNPLVKALMSVGSQLLVGMAIMAGLWIIGFMVMKGVKKAGGLSGGAQGGGGGVSAPNAIKRGGKRR